MAAVARTLPVGMSNTDGTEDGVNDRLTKLERGLEDVKAQMAWLAAILTARPPSEVQATTKPPYGLLTIVLPVVGIIAAAVIAKL
jgi:hypothetical protein